MDGDGMRLFANRTTRRLLLAVTAVLLLYALAIQFLSLHFSLSLLLLSLAASGVILILCIRYFKKQDSIIEDANDQITRILSGQRDERMQQRSGQSDHSRTEKVYSGSRPGNRKSLACNRARSGG